MDCAQLIRQLVERPAPVLPHWRQQRPALTVEAAEYLPAATGGPAAGLLSLTGWVRVAGLSANQLLTIEGAGDFQIERIESPGQAQPVEGLGSRHESRKGPTQDMDSTLHQPVVLAQVRIIPLYSTL